tara:strand:+ start:122 stop:406 length:285 start_codon:yes stop_codon:yes gene_type:complete
MSKKEVYLNGLTADELIFQFKQVVEELVGLNANKNLPENDEVLLSREQVCDMLGINLSTLWGYTKKGKLKSYGIGRRVYYKKDEVIESIIPLKK